MSNNKYKETTFIGMVKINGLSLFLNFSLLLSILFYLLIHTLITNFNFFSFENYDKIASNFYSNISGISSSIFGIVIAALAVTLSIFNQKVVSVLEETKLLHKFLFPFWFLVSCWGVLIFISTFVKVVPTEVLISYPCIFNIILGFTIWLFIYSVFMTINITGLLIRLFIQNSKVK